MLDSGMVDTQVLKICGQNARAGSSPAFGTKNYNMKKCFEFSFSHINYDDDVTTEELYIIPLETDDIDEEKEDEIIEACERHGLESHPYGVHDISFGAELVSDNVEYESIFGFNTYEVEKDKVFQLMSIWKNILENELGIKTGDVLLADYKDYN